MNRDESTMKIEAMHRYDPLTACEALAAADPVMARLIGAVGPLRMERRMQGETFESLLRAIVSQQVSSKAADTIHQRVRDLFVGRISPAALDAVSDEALRGAGLSGNKLRALRDLAARCQDGTVLGVRSLRRLDDEVIIDRLTTVRGIGRWTVEMLLIFRLRRPDVLPVDDLGVRKGFALAYDRPLPDAKELRAAGEVWAPYRSVASWYLWRASEGALA